MAIRESRGGEGRLRKEKREKGTGERKEGALVKRGVRERLTVRDCFGLKERELPKAKKKKKGKGKERKGKERFGLLKTVGRFLLLIMFGFTLFSKVGYP